MNRRNWHKLGLPFISGILLVVASYKVWSLPQGETLAAILLGASLILLGFAARDWIENDKDEEE